MNVKILIAAYLFAIVGVEPGVFGTGLPGLFFYIISYFFFLSWFLQGWLKLGILFLQSPGRLEL